MSHSKSSSRKTCATVTSSSAPTIQGVGFERFVSWAGTHPAFAVFWRCRSHAAETDRIESPWFDAQRAFEAHLMPPARSTVGVHVVLVEKAFLGKEVEVGETKRIDIILTVGRIDSVRFPANEKTGRARAGPTERYLKDMMKIAQGKAVTNLNAAPQVGAGIADHDAELINFTGSGYIVHRPEQRSQSTT